MRKAFPGLSIALKGMVDINALRGCTDPPFPPLELKEAMELKEMVILVVILKSITWGLFPAKGKTWRGSPGHCDFPNPPAWLSRAVLLLSPSPCPRQGSHTCQEKV